MEWHFGYNYNLVLFRISLKCCRFDALSHRSSGNSLNVSENLGVVSKTSTPLSGSLENIGGGELLRKNFGTRKGLASGSQSPLVTNSRNLSNTLPRKNTPSSNLEDKHEGLYHCFGIFRVLSHLSFTAGISASEKFTRNSFIYLLICP